MTRERDRSADESVGLAPVIPLFGGAHEAPATVAPAPWRSTWHDVDDDDDAFDSEDAFDECGSIELEIAETALLKRLRMRSLSVREARAIVAERDLSPQAINDLLARFEARGYLGDAALADQLIHAGVDRKGQGRNVIAQTLAKRGIPRDVADAAISALPDDDAERALEFARSKAYSLRGVDRQAALRRLIGQLARRGYGGSVAMTAARQVLDEA
ncbi:RecX family transcriptional regulator [Microbacterium lacus]|uniref:regulatory protein RecX n=1 Tax=Microbacterium lacus TaxID=415217 RepID=UPI00384AAF65